MTALTISDGFSAFGLTSKLEYVPRQIPQQPANTLISLSIPEMEKISVSARITYRLNAEEHEIFHSALRDSLQVRAELRRE